MTVGDLFRCEGGRAMEIEEKAISRGGAEFAEEEKIKDGVKWLYVAVTFTPTEGEVLIYRTGIPAWIAYRVAQIGSLHRALFLAVSPRTPRLCERPTFP